MTYHEAISCKPDPTFAPEYDVTNGVTAWAFSDLCRRKGYDQACWFADLVMFKVSDIPQDCRLIVTYKNFLTIKNRINGI